MNEVRKIMERIRINFSYIRKSTYSLAVGLLSVLGTFFTIIPVDTEKFSISRRILLIIGILFLALIVEIVRIFLKNEVTVRNYDNKKLKVGYGDLMQIAFRSGSKKKIVVIPVNRCFDTIVDDRLIEAGSIHGQWIKECLLDGISLQELDNKIEQALKNVKYDNLTEHQKKMGKLRRYPLGTIAEIKGNNNTIFYLVALTWLDENLKAHCDRYEYFRCLQCLADHYNTYGHIAPLYIPTMGCGLARVNLNLREAVETMLTIWKINREKIQEDINIIVYEKQKNVLAITDLKK